MGAPILSEDGRWWWDGRQWQAVPQPAPARARRRRTWWRILLIGGLLWLAAVLVTAATGNPNLVPTVILLGSFLVPITFVSYAFEHEATRALHVQDIFTGFVIGGVVGVLGASSFESALLPHTSVTTYVWVGLIEEACKLGALWFLARGLGSYRMRDGIVLGATVGLGFAAFESAGYAFSSLFTGHGLSLSGLIQTEVIRGVLTPVGHGLWTAILGGVLFRTARGGRLRPSRALAGWYLVVSLLHAFWDSAGGLAFFLTLAGTATGGQWYLVQLGSVPRLSLLQVVVYDGLTFGFMALDALAGLLLLRSRVRQAARLDAQA